jgi:hypothetical protein
MNKLQSKFYSRRDFLTAASLGATASLLAACTGSVARQPSPTQGPPTPAPPPAAANAASEAEAAAGAEAIVGEYTLTSEDWSGPLGFVTFKLHEALYNGEMVYHIRTDASDPAFASENKLVYVPLLNAALSREDATSYRF